MLEVLGSISSKEKQKEGAWEWSGVRERERGERLRKIEGGKEGRKQKFWVQIQNENDLSCNLGLNSCINPE